MINEIIGTGLKLGFPPVFCLLNYCVIIVWFHCHVLLEAECEFLEELLEVSGHNDICAVAWASLLPYAAELVSSSLLLTLCQDATSHVLESSLVLLGTSARPCDSCKKAVLGCCTSQVCVFVLSLTLAAFLGTLRQSAIPFPTAKCFSDEVWLKLEAVLLPWAAMDVLLGCLCCVLCSTDILLGAQNPPTCLSSLCVTAGCFGVLRSDTQLVPGADRLAVIQLIEQFIKNTDSIDFLYSPNSGNHSPRIVLKQKQIIYINFCLFLYHSVAFYVVLFCSQNDRCFCLPDHYYFVRLWYLTYDC